MALSRNLLVSHLTSTAGFLEVLDVQSAYASALSGYHRAGATFVRRATDLGAELAL
jgi:hypothetical protein